MQATDSLLSCYEDDQLSSAQPTHRPVFLHSSLFYIVLRVGTESTLLLSVLLLEFHLGTITNTRCYT